MIEEKSVGEMIADAVKPEEYFKYPDYLEKSEIIELVRRSAEKANQLKKHYGNYLAIEDMLDSKVPPAAISVLLNGIINVFKWLDGHWLFIALYGGILVSLFFMAFTGGARRDTLYYWLYSNFPENLWILLGVPLLLIFVYEILKTLKNDWNDFQDARKTITVDRPGWEREMMEEKNKSRKLYEELKTLETIGGVPVQFWFESDKIWGYFLDCKVDTLKEALLLFEKDKRVESLGKSKTIAETRLDLALMEIAYLK